MKLYPGAAITWDHQGRVIWSGPGPLAILDPSVYEREKVRVPGLCKQFVIRDLMLRPVHFYREDGGCIVVWSTDNARRYAVRYLLDDGWRQFQDVLIRCLSLYGLATREPGTWGTWRDLHLLRRKR